VNTSSNQQFGIDPYQPMQQNFNNFVNTYFNYEIEKSMRLSIQQDMQFEYDNIINEAHQFLNQLFNSPYNSLIKDAENLYLAYNGSTFTNPINNCQEIEQELFNVFSREVIIVNDTDELVETKRSQSLKIYLPLFLIKSRVEPTLVFDIYSNIKNDIFSFNLFTYTNYLLQRTSDSITLNKQELQEVYTFSFDQVPIEKKNYCIKLTDKYFIKLFLKAFTRNNNSEYIEEWLTYFFKTLRRVPQALVLVGNKDVSEEIFYNEIIKQIFGFEYCLTITDEILENQSMDYIIKNKLFIHISYIPKDEKLQKKLKDLLEAVIIHKGFGSNNIIQTPYLCQIIVTLDKPHPFLDDFLSLSKVFFIDSIENINQRLNQLDRISLLLNVANNIPNFSQQLASLDLSHAQVKNYSNQNQYITLTQQEVLNQRAIHYSNSFCLNDTVAFKDEDYKTDNELYKKWLKDPELMKLALLNNSEHPILNPFHASFEKILPIEDRYKHTYITGKTGSGKSELLKTLMYRDILNENSSIILLDIHGDLADGITRLVKDKERLVLIDPILEKDLTPTINLFYTKDKSEENVEQVSQMIASIINDINTGDNPTGSMIDLLENCIPLLVRSDNKDFYTLKRLVKDIPKVAGTKTERKIIMAIHKGIQTKLSKFRKNEFEKEYFENEFMSVNNSTRQAIRRRLNKMLKDSKFSNLTNGENTIDLAKEMNTKGKVIIFKIPKSKMLNTYKHYIKFIIGLIQIIALKRADLKEENRPHTHLYIDEFHNFITPTIEEILTESRKYKLFLTLAHQSVSQIKDLNLRDIILDNTNVKIVGKNSNKTLDMMNKTLNTKLEDVAKLKAGEFNLQSGTNDVIKINNTDKLLDGKESISDEKWEEYKQYQLEHYYRSVLKDEYDEDYEVDEDALDAKIDEFIDAIKTKDLSEQSCLKRIETLDPNRFKEIKSDFNYLTSDSNIKHPRIRQQEINIVFQLAFEQEELISKDIFYRKLRDKHQIFTKPIMMSRDKQYRNEGKVQEKYYLLS